MPVNRNGLRLASSLTLADAFIRAVRGARSLEELDALMEAIAHELGFRFYALIHHDDLRGSPEGLVDLKRYPDAVTERLIGQGLFRRDPIIRGCQFTDGAFFWTELDQIIQLDRHDHDSLAFGRREGLDIGITVPSVLLGDRLGSCTFAGARRPYRVKRCLGPVQIIGPFAFQAARRLVGAALPPTPPPRLQPRHRDCVILAGLGPTNKEIARKLAITPRTVDGYMTEAFQRLNAGNRAELAINGVLSGEVGLGEIARRQPE